jgi:LAO/AO transport system kinase
MWAMVRDQLMDRLQRRPAVRQVVPGLEQAVRNGEQTPTMGPVDPGPPRRRIS